MKKYIDISNEIKDQFKTGIQILDDVSNDIQEFLTLLQSSSGETIELIKSDLTFLKDKYTTIKEKVEKRSSEIEERANNYDACLEPYIEKKGKEIRDIDKKKDSNGCIYEYKTEILNEILGPDDSSDGIGYYNYLVKKYTMGDIGPIPSGSYPTDYIKVDGMTDFVGGFWNAFDYGIGSIVANAVTFGSDSGIGKFTTFAREKNAITMIENMNSNDKRTSRADIKIELEKGGYTPEEIQRSLENVDVDWKEQALKFARYYCNQNGDEVGFYEDLSDYLTSQNFTKEEIQYAIDHVEN